MKNREYRVLVTLALMASLVVGNIAGTSVNVQAADNKDKSTETKKTSETKTSSSATPAKDETVYVKVDDAGNQKDVTVSDQLKNISSLGTIDDVSDLKDIKNVKGDETFSENNGKLVWQGDKKDICYQGTTTKKIPVGMKVTYELDGKKVSADDLEGKSGHLKIHYEYQNTSADSGKYTPFLMATGLLMDGEKFSNVTVDNGKVISDGDRDIVIGMGLPQLKEQLTSVSSKVDDLDIPDSFTVEADVTDYEKVEAVTVATNEVFNEVGTDKFDSLDELKDSMTELQDASNKLVSGSGQLKDGLDTLLSSSGTLASGAESLNAGAAQVATGAKSAKDGAGQLESGAQALNDGIAQMQNQVGVGVNSLNSGVRQLSDGISKAKEGATSLENGATQVETGATQVSGGVAQAQTGATTLQQSLVDIAGGNDNSAMVAALESLSHTATPEQQEVLNSVIAGMEEQNKKVNDGINQAAEKAGNLSISLGTLGEGAKQVADGGASLQTGAGTLVEGLKELGTGANQLQTGVENMATQLSDGTKQLSDGTGALLAGTQSLNSGLGTLSAGAGQVSEGSAALSTNMKTANAGAQSVASGAGQLASGASQLNSGAGALSTGLNTLQSSTGALVSGVEQLDSGAAELNSGMIQFNEEGIEKLVSVFDGDVDSLLDKANELLDASKEYKNFSGIADGMDGSVKFIFVSDK